jgi:hypothetical protein
MIFSFNLTISRILTDISPNSISKKYSKISKSNSKLSQPKMSKIKKKPTSDVNKATNLLKEPSLAIPKEPYSLKDFFLSHLINLLKIEPKKKPKYQKMSL